ncbi:MAG: aminodeoxychorismate synthase component I [Bacteroidales bacterium]|nr:aminodeoxychorismate synthase component I [Bacteroidales bacterium]
MDNRIWSQQEAIAQLDAWGIAGIPFAFYCDYAQECWHIVQLTAALQPTEPCTWYFDFNLPSQRVAHLPTATDTNTPFNWQADIPNRAAYTKAFEHVMQGLKRGDSFLTNLTWRVPLHTSLTLEALFLRAKAPYKLYVPGQFCVCSPETFVTIEGTQIATYPMKGTIPANQPQALDKLLNSPKERAEHATIVDLMRNDLSQVASNVRVTCYRYAEQITTPRGGLWQTSSEITGTLHTELWGRWGSILAPLLPAGSITGAPKRATQQLIAEAEPCARHYYTGIMGVCTGHALYTAVMIRYMEQASDGFYFRAGGGITAQSHCEEEWQEVHHKAQPPIPTTP